MNWFVFILMGLVTWRLTHLLSKEDGPFNMIFLIRKQLGQGFFGTLLDCFYCLSIWTSLPLALIYGKGWSEVMLLWLALSGFACLLEQATTK